MSEITLVKQHPTEIPEADREAARRVLFGLIDGLGEHGKKQWRRFFNMVMRLEPGEMVNDLSHLGVRNLSVLPLAAAALAPVAQALRFEVGSVRTVGFFHRRQVRADGFQRGRGRRHHLVAAPFVFPGRQAIDLLAVRKERIAVSVPHLVMPNTEFARRHRPVAVQALPPHFLTAPAVFGRPVFLDALVVHQAETVSCVLPTTAFDRAKNHMKPRRLTFLYSTRYKALGNSWAVPNVRWIGRRIDMVDAITQQEKEAA